jgi:hypothetical protein
MGHAAQPLSAFGKQSGVPVILLDEPVKSEAAHASAARVVAQRLCRATAQPG